MAYLAPGPSQTARPRSRGAGRSPLTAPLLLFVSVAVMAAGYVAYVLWPRWPDMPVAINAPSLPIEIASVMFDIEPAAIRMPVQRRPGHQDRVDLAYLWPSLVPPDPTVKLANGAAVDPNEWLFVTLASAEGALPPLERVETIYPRYLVAEPTAGPDGLTLRAFRDGTPYQGEELVFDAAAPEHFLLRCSLHGVGNSGTCLVERRIGNADITMRFPRDWLRDWRSVSKGIDTLIARLHPADK